MRKICLSVFACLLMLASANKAQALDEYIYPSTPTVSVGYYDILHNGNTVVPSGAGIGDTTPPDRFDLYEVVCGVETLIDQELNPDFDYINQYSWNYSTFDYSGWQIGGVYRIRAFDSSNNALDGFEITVYDDFPMMMP